MKLECAKVMLPDINDATKLHFEHRSINSRDSEQKGHADNSIPKLCWKLARSVCEPVLHPWLKLRCAESMLTDV